MQVLAIFPSNLRAQSALSSLNLIAQRNVPSQQQLNALSKLFRQRDFAGVVASTRKLLKDYPKSFLLWNIQGAANLEIKELKEAEFSFKKAVQIKPQDPDAHNNLGNVLRELERLKEAVDSYISALRIRSDLPETHNNLGNVFMEMEDYDAALNSYGKALEFNKDSAEIHNNIGKAYLEDGQYQTALDHFKLVLEINPDQTDLHLLLGRAQRGLGKSSLAIESYNRALQINHENQSPRLELIKILADEGQNDAARSIIKELLDQASLSFPILNALSRVPHLVENIDIGAEVEKYFAKHPLETANQKIKFAFLRGRCFHHDGKVKEAVEQFELANGMLGQETAVQLKETEELMAKSLAWLTSLPPDLRDSENGSPSPLLILGPSRSGKTRLDYVLSSLKSVDSADEYRELSQAFRMSAEQNSTPELNPLGTLPDKFASSFRSNLRKILKVNHPGVDTIINTNPGLISFCASYALMEPRFKLVCIKRDPNDLAVRMFMKDYRNAKGHCYTNDLGACMRYIDWYFSMIDLLVEKFPNKTVVVQYEDMVENPLATIGKITEKFGLPGVDPSNLNIPDDRGVAKKYREFWL